MATSVKLDAGLKSRLDRLASARQRSPHWLMREAIQRYVEGERCSVVRDFCGHGVGKLFHDTPNILHYGRSGEGPVLKPGMIFTIEPMLNLGKADVRTLADGWTVVTCDRSLSAQFEHTVAVTRDGVRVLTLRPDEQRLGA